MTSFVAATHNTHKIAEFSRILAPLGIQLETPVLEDVEETGDTFSENAFLKAKAACAETGKPAVADDSGLMVDALSGAPGVYSARYAGENATDAQRIEELLFELREVPAEERSARFVSVICCVFPDGDFLCAKGICEGKIAFSARGENGFGYDPVFLCGEKTFSELSPKEKDAVSHRGKALREFYRILSKKLEEQDADK